MGADRNGPVPDQAVRDAALDATRSFVVQAPAGSGKTTLLTQRFLRLLATVERPEQVVAITFTRKAAAEMRHRLLEALHSAGRPLPATATPAERSTHALATAVLATDAARGWGLLQHPGRLHVSTIDGLNHWLAGRLPLSARLGDSAVLVDDARPLYAEAARRFVERIEEDSDTGRAIERLARLLEHDPARLAKLVADMLGRRELWLPRILGNRIDAALRASMERVLARVVSDGLARMAAAVPLPLLDELLAVLRESAALGGDVQPYAPALQQPGLPPLDGTGLDGWLRLRNLVLTGPGTVRKALNKNNGFPADKPFKPLKERALGLLAEFAQHDGAAAALQRVAGLPPASFSDEQWGLVEALGAVLVPAAVELQALFAERGCVDHTAVAGAAREALGSDDEPTDLALALDYRIQHLLVDEYQDTSQAQERLLARLLAGWPRDGSRTLFCVGDPMQSIYGFREADVTLFLGAQRHGVGGLRTEPLHLAANFRSCGAVIRWVNDTFAALLPAADDFERGAVRYTACAATRGDEPHAGVHLHPLFAPEPAAEAARIADLVQAALARADERAAGDAPGSRPREVALLVRARAGLPLLIAALRARGIAYRGVELESLAERRAVADLVALARALVHDGDRTAWLAVLRAPWCGLGLADLETIAGVDRHLTLRERLADPAVAAGLGDDGRRRLARVRPLLEAACREVGRAALGSTVRSAWLALGGPATVEDESDLANAESVFSALDQLALESGHRPAPSDFARAIAQLKAAPLGAADARVVIMTIHKAKGLEFDTVILPGLERRVSGDGRRLLYWTSVAVAPDVRELLLASTGERDERDDPPPLERWMRALETDRRRLETGRLAYVAATRARCELHLVGSVEVAWSDEAGEPGIRPPRGDTLLGFLWPVLQAEFSAALAGELAAGTLRQPEPKRRPRLSDGEQRRLPAGFAAAVPEAPAWTPPALPSGVPQPVRPDFDWAGEIARAVGTVVHAELVQRAAGGRAAAQPAASARRRVALLAAGAPQARLDEALARVDAALAGVEASERGRWLLDPAHAEAASELALSALVDGEVVSIKVDRTFVAADGTRWIVDWKTGSHEGGDRDVFLANELQRYSTQLQRYAQVLQLYDGRPQRIGLYFPLLDAWAEWHGRAAAAGPG